MRFYLRTAVVPQKMNKIEFGGARLIGASVRHRSEKARYSSFQGGNIVC
jgi:hypothetical protein